MGLLRFSVTANKTNLSLVWLVILWVGHGWHIKMGRGQRGLKLHLQKQRTWNWPKKGSGSHYGKGSRDSLKEHPFRPCVKIDTQKMNQILVSRHGAPIGLAEKGGHFSSLPKRFFFFISFLKVNKSGKRYSCQLEYLTVTSHNLLDQHLYKGMSL